MCLCVSRVIDSVWLDGRFVVWSLRGWIQGVGDSIWCWGSTYSCCSLWVSGCSVILAVSVVDTCLGWVRNCLDCCHNGRHTFWWDVMDDRGVAGEIGWQRSQGCMKEWIRIVVVVEVCRRWPSVGGNGIIQASSACSIVVSCPGVVSVC